MDTPMTEHNHFTDHRIKQHVSADGFGSWLLQRVHEDGGWDRTFWVRITAADGLLRVTGDFNPIVFAHGPLDPVTCVGWMGDRPVGSPYVSEKASIGSGGRDVISRWSTEDAAEDIREMIAGEAWHREEHDGEPSRSELALREGLELRPDYSDHFGCLLIHREIMDHDGDAWEYVGSIGRRTSHALELAHLAVRRLWSLISEESS